MNIIAFINGCALVICVVSTGVIAFRIIQKKIPRMAGVFAIVSTATVLFICISNVLQHTGLTDALDEYEGFAGNLFALFFLLFLYVDSILKELRRRARNERMIQESLEEKTTLLKEIHHRVKNNLQIVSSLLSLQGSALGDERVSDVFSIAKTRISAIAAVHEIIYSSKSLSRLKASVFLNSIIANLAMTYDPGKRNIEIGRSLDESVYLDVDNAVPVGLILNELLSNSLKHAFSGSSSGRIDVRLRRAGEKIELCVDDTGTGMAAGANHPAGGRGIGMDLVKSLARQVGGEMKIDTGEGTCVSVVFPDAAGKPVIDGSPPL